MRELENIVKRIVVLGDEGAAHEVIERRQITVPITAAARSLRAAGPHRPTAATGSPR